MSAPSPPTITAGTSGELLLEVTVELSRAQVATLEGSSDALVQVGTNVTVPGFVNLLQLTVSRRAPVVP